MGPDDPARWFGGNPDPDRRAPVKRLLYNNRGTAKSAGVLAWLLWFVLALGCRAQVVTLANNNSQVVIDTSSSSGMFSWMVDGRQQISQQWFWFRVGSGP